MINLNINIQTNHSINDAKFIAVIGTDVIPAIQNKANELALATYINTNITIDVGFYPET